MEMWLSSNSESIQFPVLPSEFELTGIQNNTVVSINNLGEINLLGKRGLESISVSSFFPHENYDFCKVTPKEPYTYCNIIKQWKNDNEILRFILTGTNINLACTIESFAYGEKDNVGDVYFKIDLKEYRTVSTARVTKTYKTTNYTVKSGDTWYSIARKITGNSANAATIASQNKMKLTSKLKKGKKLVIKYEA